MTVESKIEIKPLVQSEGARRELGAEAFGVDLESLTGL